MRIVDAVACNHLRNVPFVETFLVVVPHILSLSHLLISTKPSSSQAQGVISILSFLRLSHRTRFPEIDLSRVLR